LSELSKRQQTIKRRKHLHHFKGHSVEARAKNLATFMKLAGHQKLVPDLGVQDRKAIHVEHAQELRKNGAVFTEMYACYSFRQKRIFKAEIERCSSARAASTDEMEKGVYKLILNTPYGKTLENKRDRRNSRAHRRA
jgi:hypothetical protein